MLWIRILSVVAAGVTALACSALALAAPVVCGVGSRTVIVNPGLVGGLCHHQIGNLQDADIAALGLVSLDKDEVGDFPLAGDPSEGALQFGRTGNASGTWSFLQSLWTAWDRLFLGVGFGERMSPVNFSFVVELSPFDIAGTFARPGGPGTQIPGLANVHLLGIRCQTPECNGPPPAQVAEPSTVLLLSLGLLALAGTARVATP